VREKIKENLAEKGTYDSTALDEKIKKYRQEKIQRRKQQGRKDKNIADQGMSEFLIFNLSFFFLRTNPDTE
jgi:hypothetical protein